MSRVRIGGADSMKRVLCNSRPTVIFPVTEHCRAAHWPVLNYTAGHEQLA